MRFLFVVSLFFTTAVDDFGTCLANSPTFMSILGDHGMTNPDARFALEALNACNEVGEEAPGMGSPRLADCADLSCSAHSNNKWNCHISQKVNETANLLKAGDQFPGSSRFNSLAGVDIYAAEKEKYIGSLCETKDIDDNEAWYFWMYSYQDPGYKKAAKRIWRSIMVGTEMYNLNKSDDRQYTAQWTVSNFDVVVPNLPKKK